MHTVRYHSSRAEVWRWYWRAWRKSLWRIHLAIAFIASAVVSSKGFTDVNLRSLIVWFLSIFPLTTFVLAVLPLVRFKSEERTLNAGPNGCSTQIGKIEKSFSWSDIASIRNEQGVIVFAGADGNAMLIPLRAFADDRQRSAFFADACQWHSDATGQRVSE